MEKYIKSITALNKLTLSVMSGNNKTEVDRYAESDIFWATNKCSPLLNRQVKRGNIYQFEFGKNFIPEMSYEHRGLVIGTSGKLLYVLPICSYNEKIPDHKNAYHPTDNPTSKGNYFLLKGSEHPFLTHDSVLKLNDIRTVSVARIKYKQENGYIDPASATYKAIERIVFTKYFSDYSFQFDRLNAENASLTQQLNETRAACEAVEERIASMKEMLEKHGFDEASQAYMKKALNIE